MTGVDEESREIDLLQEAQMTEEGGMDSLPAAGKKPGLETSPAGHPRATAHFLGEIFPGDAGLEYEENACERFAIVQGRPTTLGPRRPLREVRFDKFPQFIR